MSSPAENAPVSEPWEPLSVLDYSILGLIGTLQAFALLICVHLLKWRKWPPYVTKSPMLVVITTFSGVLWTVSMAIASGFIKRERGDILAACDFERFVSWSTLCVHTVAFFIRVYRMWRILIKHDDKMWRPEYQILFMSSVSLIPVIATWIAPRSGTFDEIANTCASNTLSAAVVLGMDCLGFLAICFLWFVCARQLKSVRKQFNEYDTMKRTLLYMTITLASYALVVVILLADDLVLQRRVAIFYPLLTTYILLWGSIREPFLMKLLGDNEYLWSYTKGFAELPSPAQLKASLAEQLSVDQLRDEFRRYIKTKVAQELVDFYLDSLDREEVTGFFERQAITMRIVEQYIREGAPDQVNISEECRETILATDVTAFNIFDEARKEVLMVMETNFRKDFVTTEGFQRILDASEEEQRELRLLKAGGMLPVGSPSTPPGGSAVDERKNSAPSSLAGPPAGNKSGEPAESPSFLEGLKDALNKLPFLARSAEGASEARSRRRGGKGGARVGGAVRGLAADSTDATIDSGLVVAPWLQAQGEGEEDAVGREAPRVARSEVGGDAATAAGDVEMGKQGARVGPVVSGCTPEMSARAWTGVAGSDSSVNFGAPATVAASPSHDKSRIGGETSSGGHDGEQYVLVAVPQQASSLALSLSASASGSNGKGENSDNPSTDSLLGIYLTSWPDSHVHRSSSGGGDGRELKPFASTPGADAFAGGEGRDFATGRAQEKSSTFSTAGPPAGVVHARPDWMYQVPTIGGSGRGFARLGDFEEGSSGSSSSPAGLERLGHAAFTSPALQHRATPVSFAGGSSPAACTIESTNTTGSWLVQADSEAANKRKRRASGGEREPGLMVIAHGNDDRVPREDGVEGLEKLSPVLTEDSPDWVRFSEWIEREQRGAASESDGTATGGSAGDSRVGARKTMASSSPAASGGGPEQTGGSWCSGSSSWSNSKNPTSGSDNASPPRTPPRPPANDVEAE